MISLAELTMVIPAFNEAGAIGHVLERLRHELSPAAVLVVDDGSTDGTAHKASAVAGVRVVSHGRNRGNGACIKTALKHVKTPYVCVLDADGQHDAAYILQLIEHLPEHDLVVGARTQNADQRNVVRALGNWFLRLLAGSLAKEEIPDLTSGFRAFKREVIAQFTHIYPEGFSFPTTSTLACLTNGYAVRFVPVIMPPRIAGESKIRVFKDGWRFIKLIFRMTTIFAPSRLMYPLSVLCFLAGVIYSVYHVLYIELKLPGGSVLTLVLAAVFFCFGMVMDQVASLRIHMRR